MVIPPCRNISIKIYKGDNQGRWGLLDVSQNKFRENGSFRYISRLLAQRSNYSSSLHVQHLVNILVKKKHLTSGKRALQFHFGS